MPTPQRSRLLFQGSSSFLKKNAVAAWKASRYDGSSYLKECCGRSAFDARLGSAIGADTNDPLFLDYLGTKYLYLPGVNGNYASAPDTAALSITGDLDIRVAVAMDDWTPAAAQHLLAKYNTGSNQRSYHLRVETAGTLSVVISTTGVDTNTRTSTVAPAVTDGALLLVRVIVDVDNGAAGNDVKFYTKASTEATAYADALSDAGWTQLGATVTNAGILATFDSTAALEVGSSSGGTNPTAGKFYAAVVKNGIAGTTAFAADFTSTPVEPYATFVESSANAATVTINRSTTGRKAAMVARKMFLLGTDDYFEVPDNALLNFAGTDSFTLVAVIRAYGQPEATIGRALSKQAAGGNPAATPGWQMYMDVGTGRATLAIHDGAASTFRNGPAWTNGVLITAVGVRNVAADTLTRYDNGVASAGVTDTTTGTLANAQPLRIGARSDAVSEPFNGEFVAAAIFRRPLTAAEIAQATTELLAA